MTVDSLTVLEARTELLSKTKMLAGLVPCAAVRANLFQASSLATAGLLAVLRVPWLVDTHHDLFLCSHGFLCLCVQLSPSRKDTSRTESGSTQMTSSQLIISAVTPFPYMIPF